MVHGKTLDRSGDAGREVLKSCKQNFMCGTGQNSEYRMPKEIQTVKARLRFQLGTWTPLAVGLEPCLTLWQEICVHFAQVSRFCRRWRLWTVN